MCMEPERAQPIADVAALAPPPAPAPAVAAPSRTARIAGKVLKGSGVAIAICLGGIFINIGMNTRMWALMNCMAVGIVISAAIGLLAAIVRLSASIFAESDVRLGELLATFLFAGAVTSALLAWMDPARMGQEQRLAAAISAVVSTFLFAGAGSAWGWSMSRRMKIVDGRARLKLLAVGWALTVGSLSGFFVAFVSLIWITERRSFPWEITPYFIAAGFATLLTAPGIIMELKWRRSTKQKQPV